METQNRSRLSAGLKSLSSHLHKINRSGINYIKLSEESVRQLRGLKESIKSQFKIDLINAPASTKSEFIEDIKSKVSQSEEIINLGTLREKLVFSSGSPEAKIMFIGEAPGQEEELQGKPFVGPSGQLLTKIINAMGLNRDDVYISNIVKFRPKIDVGNQGASNRKPSNDEMRISLPFILEEIDVIKPIVVVALGGTAMQGLLNMNGTISSARGKLHEVQGAKVVVSYHPSFLLRSKTPNKDKRKMWEDMLLAMNLLGMKITEKQKNYFK
ncbi:MAG: uracil-DNA glycosylase [Verrucomicrobiales bacterium]|nr:uracil-DNA glycosylase [Verrucomicrobiales bacterium]